MSSVNKVFLIGYLGTNPETRYFNNTRMTTFSLATNESWIDKNKLRQNRTQWHNIVTFGKLAEVASKYLTQGSQVLIIGSIQSNKYTDQKGIERIAYNIKTSELTMLNNKSQSVNASSSQSSQIPAPPQRQQTQNFEADPNDIPF